MDHTPADLEHISQAQADETDTPHYTPRPRSHIILAWILVAVVLFAFLGTCYWLAFYRP